MKVTVWTVNELDDIARMVEIGVDGMASDYPDRVIDLLGKRGLR
jgi:glycerophosphoryl diester phosphodiesterase